MAKRYSIIPSNHVSDEVARIEELDQEITLALLQVDNNILRATNIINDKFLPIIRRYLASLRGINDSVKFWKLFFEGLVGTELMTREEPLLAASRSLNFHEDSLSASGDQNLSTTTTDAPKYPPLFPSSAMGNVPRLRPNTEPRRQTLVLGLPLRVQRTAKQKPLSPVKTPQTQPGDEFYSPTFPLPPTLKLDLGPSPVEIHEPLLATGLHLSPTRGTRAEDDSEPLMRPPRLSMYSEASPQKGISPQKAFSPIVSPPKALPSQRAKSRDNDSGPVMVPPRLSVYSEQLPGSTLLASALSTQPEEDLSMEPPRLSIHSQPASEGRSHPPTPGSVAKLPAKAYTQLPRVRTTQLPRRLTTQLPRVQITYLPRVLTTYLPRIPSTQLARLSHLPSVSAQPGLHTDPLEPMAKRPRVAEPASEPIRPPEALPVLAPSTARRTTMGAVATPEVEGGVSLEEYFGPLAQSWRKLVESSPQPPNGAHLGLR